MLNTIILDQNVSFATSVDYIACMRKKSEFTGDYLEIWGYTKVMCDYRKYHLMWFSCFALFYIRLRAGNIASNWIRSLKYGSI